VFVADRQLGRGHGQPDGAGEIRGVERIDGDRRRGLGQAIGLRQRLAGDGAPAFGDRALHRHAAAQGQAQVGEIQLGEIRVVDQGVEQGIDAGEDIDRRLAPGSDQRRLVARIDDQQIAHAGMHAVEAADRHGEHVVQRQRADDRQLPAMQVVQHRLRHGFGLQHVGYQVAMRQHGALGYAGGAAGVLQHGQVVHAQCGRRERGARAVAQGIRQAVCPVDAPRRNQLLHIARRQVDQRRFQASQQVARADHHDMRQRAAIGHRLQRVREILQDDDRLGAAVEQLALQFVGLVERIDVHHHHAGAQRPQQAHQVGGHVGHHQRHARAARQAAPLQPGGEVPRMGIQLRIGHVRAHRAAGHLAGMAPAGLVQQVGQRRVVLRRNLVGNPRGIVGEPGAQHGVCLH